LVCCSDFRSGFGCGKNFDLGMATPLQVQRPLLQVTDPSHVKQRPFIHMVLAASADAIVKNASSEAI
jgi:hypothetical protein